MNPDGRKVFNNINEIPSPDPSPGVRGATSPTRHRGIVRRSMMGVLPEVRIANTLTPLAEFDPTALTPEEHRIYQAQLKHFFRGAQELETDPKICRLVTGLYSENATADPDREAFTFQLALGLFDLVRVRLNLDHRHDLFPSEHLARYFLFQSERIWKQKKPKYALHTVWQHFISWLGSVSYRE
jgi:hypothetical protein